MTAGQPPRTPPSVSKKLTARGYVPTEDSENMPVHPMAKEPAPTFASDAGKPWIAQDGERRVPKADTRSGLDKAYSATRPVGGKPNGGRRPLDRRCATSNAAERR